MVFFQLTTVHFVATLTVLLLVGGSIIAMVLLVLKSQNEKLKLQNEKAGKFSSILTPRGPKGLQLEVGARRALS